MTEEQLKGAVEQTLEQKLVAAFQPNYLAIENESGRHAVPVNSETHFKVLIVSGCFEGKNRVARHRAINLVLQAELAGPIHALSLRALTSEEYAATGDQNFVSPDCAGQQKS